MADSKTKTKSKSKSKTRNKPNSEEQIKIIKELEKFILPRYELTRSEKKKIIKTLKQNHAFNIPSRISGERRDKLLKLLNRKRLDYHKKTETFKNSKKSKKQDSRFNSLLDRFTNLTSTIRI